MHKNIHISNYTHLYFVGIGGIGMSALAKYFVVSGKKVAGYDKVASLITKSLIEQGVAIHYKEDIQEIPDDFFNPSTTLVIYTPAIPNDHKELNYFKKHNFKILKRAQVLGLITKESFCFAVAGTHGKTTTSTILGHILKETGVNATSFLGGIAANYNSNLILGNDKISVVEADEYDRSFLQLSPNYACITSMDADHLDIYGQAEELESSFKDFASIVADKLFVKEGLPLNGITYGFSDTANYQAKNIRSLNGTYVFDVKTPTEIIENIPLHLLGEHNVSNALVALAMANEYGVSLPKIKKAIESFKGIDRRFNIKINTDNLVLIDDYAHHPTEINAVFKTIATTYPEKEKIVIFQPHLFSRTQDFANN
ncbi:MAG TPA: UDP-N-acetylmuramate--L-alanine ligase, partial [Flavobacteriia bacterium]|nr:UDP-N-acetylmuramate--L-alanine ligase [Flavobacteriia bacterium]